METIKKAKSRIDRYKLQDGTSVPSVTTILGVLNKPALLVWANNFGLQGYKIGEYVDELAQVGSCAHSMVEAMLKGGTPDLDDYSKAQIDLAENSILSFLEWQRQNSFEVIETELLLVSERLRYGGTIDCYCKLNGKLTILDFKTGKAIYDEHILQVSAYKNLAIENGYPVNQVGILQIGRTEDEGFSECYISDTETHFELFKSCLNIYNLQKLLKNNNNKKVKRSA
jgi:hypothetical protein